MDFEKQTARYYEEECQPITCCLDQSHLQSILVEQLELSGGLAQFEIRPKKASKKSVTNSTRKQRSALKERNMNCQAQKENEPSCFNDRPQKSNDFDGSSVIQNNQIDQMKDQVEILRKLTMKQQEEKLLFCYKYKQMYQKCLQLMKQVENSQTKLTKKDAFCQTEQTQMLFGNISASAIENKCNLSSFNQWLGGPQSNSQVLAQSQQSPVSQFMGLSAAKSKVIKFNDEADHDEQFRVRKQIGKSQSDANQSQLVVVLNQSVNKAQIDNNIDEPAAAIEMVNNRQTDTRLSESLQLKERFSSQLVSNSQRESMMPSHINFYTENTNGDGAIRKNTEELYQQEFMEKCQSDTLGIDEKNNSYLDHIRNYNGVNLESAVESQQNENLLVDSNTDAVLILDQQSAQKQCDDQVSFSMVTKGELQKCIKASRNNNAPREVPTLILKQQSEYSNAIEQTPSRTPNGRLQGLVTSHLSQQKPERILENSFEIGSDQKQHKIIREKELRKKLKEMVLIGRQKEATQDDKVFQSEIMDTAWYLSSDGVTAEEPGQHNQINQSICNINQGKQQTSGKINGNLVLVQDDNNQKEHRNKAEKFISYVTMLGQNVANQNGKAVEGCLLRKSNEQVLPGIDWQTSKDVPSSINSCTQRNSLAMHSLKFIEEQIDHEQRCNRQALQAVIQVGQKQDQRFNTDTDMNILKSESDLLVEQKVVKPKKSRRHSNESETCSKKNQRQKLGRYNSHQTEFDQNNNQSMIRPTKEQLIPVLEVDLVGLKKKKNESNLMESQIDKLAVDSKCEAQDQLDKQRKAQLFDQFKTSPRHETQMKSFDKTTPQRNKANKPPIIATLNMISPSTIPELKTCRPQTYRQKMMTQSILSKQSALNNYYRNKNNSRLGLHHTFITGRASLLTARRVEGVKSVLDNSPYNRKYARLNGRNRNSEHRTMYTYEQAKEQQLLKNDNLEPGISPQKCPRPPNLHGTISPLTQGGHSSMRPSYTQLARHTRLNAPSACNQKSNQESLIFSPSKDFWKNKCQQLLYQKQKNAAEMIGQRERLDWCVREIERLKQLGDEKHTLHDKNESNQQKSDIKGQTLDLDSPNKLQPVDCSKEQKIKIDDAITVQNETNQIEMSKLNKLEQSSQFVTQEEQDQLWNQNHQHGIELKLKQVETNQYASEEDLDQVIFKEEPICLENSEKPQIDLICNEQLPDEEENRSPRAFQTRKSDGCGGIFPQKDSCSRRSSPPMTNLHPSNLPSKVQSLAHSPKTPFDSRHPLMYQCQADQFDIDLLAKKKNRDQMKKQEHMGLQHKAHYSHLKRHLNYEQNQTGSLPECSRNLQGLFEEAAALQIHQISIDSQNKKNSQHSSSINFNKLCHQRSADESTKIVNQRRGSYGTVNVDSNPNMLPLRDHPPYIKTNDSYTGLSSSLNLNKMFAGNSLMTSSINSGSGKITNPKTFCYQPVKKNNLIQNYQQNQKDLAASIKKKSSQVIETKYIGKNSEHHLSAGGIQLQSSKLGSSSCVLQDSKKNVINSMHVVAPSGSLRHPSSGQIQTHHQRTKTNLCSDYQSSTTQNELMSSNGPCSKLTPHPKVFGVESQSLLYGKVHSASNLSCSGQSADNEQRLALSKQKENKVPVRTSVQLHVEIQSLQSRMQQSLPASRAEANIDNCKTLSAGRSFFEQIKMKSSKQNGRRLEGHSSIDMHVSDSKQRMSQDSKVDSQKLRHQKLLNPPAAEDEKEQSKAPLTPCYPSIKKSLFSLKHASVLGERKEQLFQNQSTANIIQPNNPATYLIPAEPHSATGIQRQYSSVKRQSLEQAKIYAPSAFSYSKDLSKKEHQTAPNSRKNSGNARKTAHENIGSPASLGFKDNQQYHYNYMKECEYSDTPPQHEKNSKHHKSIYGTLKNEAKPMTRGTYNHPSQMSSHTRTDSYLQVQTKGLSRQSHNNKVPRPAQGQQLQMGPQGTSKQINRKLINADGHTPTFNTSASCSSIPAAGQRKLKKNNH